MPNSDATAATPHKAPQKAREIQLIIHEVARGFHLHASTSSGRAIVIPVGYQINEPGFRTFRGGKATAEELQQELDRVAEEARTAGVNLGIEGMDSLKKLCIQLGLGIDCSNFAFRTLATIHERLGLEPYAETVFRDADEILALHSTKEGWSAKDPSGDPRPLTAAELARLDRGGPVSAAWIAKVFGKDPAFIVAAKHLASPYASTEVAQSDLMPGDLIAITNRDNGRLHHVGIVSFVRNNDDGPFAYFWHVAHTRDANAGLRQDTFQPLDYGHMCFSYEPFRSSQEGITFHRPNGLGRYLACTAKATESERGSHQVEMGAVLSRSSLVHEDRRARGIYDPIDVF